MKIRLLDEKTINKIAAGEVVENAASVVKELVENSLDAKATSVEVAIEGGGLTLIQVADDGVGMNADDALLSLERHGTSKIRAAADLESIDTMGFRGEALAAISSISRFDLKTAEEGEVGTHIFGGRLQKCARQKGTTIEVRSLFYNVPARKKFQKSAASQTSEVVKIMTRLALSHPTVSFTLTSNGRLLFQTYTKDLKQRAEDLLGRDFLKEAYEVEADGVRGFVGRVSAARGSRSGQYLFINGRAVQPTPLAYGVEEAFGTRLSSRTYPVFVLFIEMPPQEVDVNVHPQKLQVRLKNEREWREKNQKGSRQGAAKTKTESSCPRI